jgi:branched-chain amino acid aminotransferase
VLKAAAAEDARLRITLTKGTPPGLFVEVRTLALPAFSDYANGIAAVVWPHPRQAGHPLRKHKTLCYAENMLAREFAANRKAYEAIFVNSAGNVAEGATTNLFLVRNGELFTPPISAGILPGITRDVVIGLCRTLRLQCNQRNICLPDLQRADEAFLTNSIIGILPLVRLHGRRVGTGRPGEVTRLLAMQYRMLLSL